MDTLKTLEGIVRTMYNELQEYTKTYNKKAEEDRAKLLKSRSILESEPDNFDVDSIARDIMFINGHHQVDIRKLQESTLTAYKLYRSLGGDSEFDKEMIDTMNILQASLPKQIFVVDKGEFVEIEEGRVETLKKEYRSKGYYKYFESQVKKLMDDE